MWLSPGTVVTRQGIRCACTQGDTDTLTPLGPFRLWAPTSTGEGWVGLRVAQHRPGLLASLNTDILRAMDGMLMVVGGRQVCRREGVGRW